MKVSKEIWRVRTLREAAKEKELVQQAEQVMLQQFQDTICKRLAELRRNTEASVATLGWQSSEFPTGASMSDFFSWFQKEIKLMPTAFTECNKNITCYTLVSVFQMLVGEGCEHVPELKELALSYNELVLQDFPTETGWVAKRHVKNWWTKHGLPYYMKQIKEKNRVSSGIYFCGQVYMCHLIVCSCAARS
jgi:hypothetical protein